MRKTFKDFIEGKNPEEEEKQEPKGHMSFADFRKQSEPKRIEKAAQDSGVAGLRKGLGDYFSRASGSFNQEELRGLGKEAESWKGSFRDVMSYLNEHREELSPEELYALRQELTRYDQAVRGMSRDIDRLTAPQEGPGPEQRPTGTPWERYRQMTPERTGAWDAGRAGETAAEAVGDIIAGEEKRQGYIQGYHAGRTPEVIGEEITQAYNAMQETGSDAELDRKIGILYDQIRQADPREMAALQGEKNRLSAEKARRAQEKKEAEERLRALQEEKEWAERIREAEEFENLDQRPDYVAMWKKGQEAYGKLLEEGKDVGKDWEENRAELWMLPDGSQDFGGTMAAQGNLNRRANRTGLVQIDILTPKEKTDYFYLLAKKGPEKAKEFFNIKAAEHREKNLLQLQKTVGENAGTRAIASAASVAALPWAWMDPIIRTYFPNAVGPAELRDTARGGVAQALEEKGLFNTGLLKGQLPEEIPVVGGQGLGFGYNTAMSMADSAAAMGLAGAGGTYILAGAAASSAYNDALKAGATEEQALLQGMAQGIAEGLFEYVSIDKLLKQDLSEGLIKAAIKQGGVEASEEAMTSLANAITDTLIMKDKSVYDQAAMDGIRSGLSREEAERRAAKGFFRQLSQDALGGFLSGAAMTAGHKGIDTVNRRLPIMVDTVRDVKGAVDERIRERKQRAADRKAEKKQAGTEDRSIETVDHSGDLFDQKTELEQAREMWYDKGVRMEEQSLAQSIEERRSIAENEAEDPRAREAARYHLEGLQRAWEETHPEAPGERIENDGGRESFNDSPEWDEGLGASEPAGGMEEGPGEPGQGGSEANTGRNLQGPYERTTGEKVSAQALGIRDGSDEKTLAVVPEAQVQADEGLRRVAERARADGVELTLYTGRLRVMNRQTGKYQAVEGVYSPTADGKARVYIKADGRYRSAEQVYLHEEFHRAAAQNPGILKNVREWIVKKYGMEEIARIASDYADAYNGIYGTVTKNMTEEEAEAVAMRYVEEAAADIWAGIKRGRKSMKAVREAVGTQKESVEEARKSRAQEQETGQKYSAESVEEEGWELDEAFRRQMDGEIPAQDTAQRELMDMLKEDAEFYGMAKARKENAAAGETAQALEDRIEKARNKVTQIQAAEKALKEEGYYTARERDSIRDQLKNVRETLSVYNAALREKKAAEAKKKKAERRKKQEEEIKGIQAQTAKRQLRDNILDIFSVKAGMRADMAALIYDIGDQMVENGRVDYGDRADLLEALLMAGEETVDGTGAPGVAETLRNGKIYVSEELRAELGDYFKELRSKAFGLRLYLTGNKSDPGVDVWVQNLREEFPRLIPETATGREALEAIVKMAQDAKGQKLSLLEMMQRQAEQYGWSVEEQISDLSSRLDRELEKFAEKADLEIRIRKAGVRQLLSDQEHYKKIMEARKQRAMESQARENLLKSIRKLQKLKGKSLPAIQAQIDETVGQIDTVARGISPEGIENLQYLAQEYYRMSEDLGDNFLRSDSLEKKLHRLGQIQINDMSIEEVRELGTIVSELATNIRNQNRLLASERQETVREMSESVKREIAEAQGASDRKGAGAINKVLLAHTDGKRFFGHISGWADGATQELGEELSRGQEKEMHYQMDAMRVFDPFLQDEKNKAWVEKSSGKNAEWQTVKVPGAVEVMQDGTVKKLDSIRLTPMMKVSLIMHSRNSDNTWHIGHWERAGEGYQLEGGLTIPDETRWKRGDAKGAYDKGKVIRIPPATLKALSMQATAQEKEFARYLTRYFDGLAKTEINRVSTVVDGIERAAVKNYFPIQSDKAFIPAENQLLQQDLSLTGNGSLHERHKGAQNPIFLMDASRVLQRNIEQTARYVGFTIPIRDVQAVLNATYYGKGKDVADAVYGEDPETGKKKSKVEGWGNLQNGSVKKVLEQKWGSDAVRYLEELLKDLQVTEDRGDLLSDFMEKLRGKYARAVISFNPSSALKQTGSFISALAILDPESLAAGMAPKSMAQSVKNLEKYSAVYWYRNQGNATQELQDVTKQREFGDKLPLGYNWAQGMDSWVTRRLLAACEHQVQKQTGLQPGSQEDIDKGVDRYWIEVSKLFNKVVLETQSNSSIMERARLTRSPSKNASRWMTMFRSDAFQQFNMIEESMGRLRAAKRRMRMHDSEQNREAYKAAKKQAARTMGSVIASNVWTGVIQALIANLTWRDDDVRDEEGKIQWEAVFKNLAINSVQNMAGIAVGGQELAELIEIAIDKNMDGDKKFWGYSMNSLEMVSDFVDSTVKLITKNNGEWGKTVGAARKFALNAAQLMGLPVKNVEKYVLSMVRWISPYAGELYENLWDEKTKSKLSREGGRTIDEAIRVLMNNRTDGLSKDQAAEISRLYKAGMEGAVPSAVPMYVSYEGADGSREKHVMDGGEQRDWEKAWNETVSAALPGLLGSPTYLNASDEEKEDLLNRLYGFAREAANQSIEPAASMTKENRGIQAAVDGGIPLHEAVQAAKAEDLKALRALDLTDEQEETVWREQMSTEARGREEEALREAGLSWDQAVEIVEGKEKKAEKLEAISRMPVSQKAIGAAMKTYATEAEAKAIDGGLAFGVDMAAYAEALAAITKEGSMSQKKATEYLRDQGYKGQEAAWLWQMLTDGAPKNNPFSTYYGMQLHTEMHKDDGKDE